MSLLKILSRIKAKLFPKTLKKATILAKTNKDRDTSPETLKEKPKCVSTSYYTHGPSRDNARHFLHNNPITEERMASTARIIEKEKENTKTPRK